jgi:hypothetical protein
MSDDREGSAGPIDYQRALRYQLDDDDWWTNLLFVTVGMIVPLVGPVVVMGYQAQVIEALARGGRNAPPPRVDLARFTDYLLRGLRMFLVTVVLTLLLTPVLLVVLFVGNMFGLVLFAQEEMTTSILGFIVVAVAALLFTAVMVVGIVLVTPLFVRAALSPDLAAIFEMAFVRDFFARVGRDTLIAHIVHMLLNLALFLAGLLACFIGVFPAIAFGMLVQAHLFGQLYLLYLERGGRRVEPPG